MANNITVTIFYDIPPVYTFVTARIFQISSFQIVLNLIYRSIPRAILYNRFGRGVITTVYTSSNNRKYYYKNHYTSQYTIPQLIT